MESANRKLRVAIIVALIFVAMAGIWYWTYQRRVPQRDSGLVEEPGIGGQIFERIENPTKNKFPESNPFAADTNPFDANTNPYNDEYKNPFQ